MCEISETEDLIMLIMVMMTMMMMGLLWQRDTTYLTSTGACDVKENNERNVLNSSRQWYRVVLQVSQGRGRNERGHSGLRPSQGC